MAVAATTSGLDRTAIYQKELADYKAKTDKWAKIGAPPATPAAAPDQNSTQNRAQEAYPAPAVATPKKKKKKSCMQKTGAVLGKVAKVAVPAVVGFFTGGPVGAALGAAQGAAGLAKQQA